MKKRTDYRRRHKDQRFVADADRAEFYALRDGAAEIDSGVYPDRVAGTLDDLDDNIHDAEDWQRDDLRYDTAVGRTCEEIERRVQVLGDAYPFKLKDGILSHLNSASSIYEFFLSICNSTTLAKGVYVKLPRLFERIAAKLVAEYFGGYAQGIHTGWPRDPETGSSFTEAMQHVSDLTGEFKWAPGDGLPIEQHQGDEGCDFIVWLSTPDQRQVGQLFVLGQCACGNDWQSKYDDLDVKKLQKWFNPLSVVDPVKSFATPHHVTDVVLREASRQAGLFFDRARLTMTAHGAGGDVIGDEMRKSMKKLIDLVLRDR